MPARRLRGRLAPTMLLPALAFAASACDRHDAPAATDDDAERAELSRLLTEQGFAALAMSEEERAALSAAGKATNWERLPAESFPERIRRFEGVEARIEGWMIPGRIEKSRVLDFMLVRDNAACCFGAMPGDDEWIQVVMIEGAHATYMRYAKIAVTGVLEIGGEGVVEGLRPPALRMLASHCEIVEKPR